MGASAYTDYLVSIQVHIGTLIDLATSLEEKVHTLRARVETGTNVEESQTTLEENCDASENGHATREGKWEPSNVDRSKAVVFEGSN